MPSTSVEQTWRQLRIIWLAIMGGVVVLGAVLWFLSGAGVPSEPVLDAGLMNVFGPVLLVLMMASQPVGRALAAHAERTDGGAAARVRVYMTSRVVVWAMVEGAGVVLMVLGLLSGARIWIMLAAAAALLVLALSGPDRDVLTRLGRGV